MPTQIDETSGWMDIPWEKCISLEKRLQIIGKLKIFIIITKNKDRNNGVSKNINLHDNTKNQWSKFRSNNWVGVNDDGVEYTTQIVKSCSGLQCWSHVFVTRLMHTYVWTKL